MQKMMAVHGTGFLALLLLSPPLWAGETRPPGSERTYYTATRLRAMTDNLRHYDWARKERDEIVARADKWLRYSDSRLSTLVPPPTVPRAAVAHTEGAPVKGDELKRKGAYSWIVDFDHPWKVKHPITGEFYPSNDFEAFMRSGFKDRSLLTGDYPDDGWGCRVEGYDKPFWFVAVYAHWSAARLLLPAVDDLSRAYLLTDDGRYAHACAVLLWQLAEYYPDYYYEKQSRHAKEVRPDYLGRLLYHTWEALNTCHVVPPAYDAVRRMIDADRGLQRLAGRTGQEIRQRIEDRVLRTMAGDIMDGSRRIAGNYGMHQVALLRIAAVLGDSERTPTRKEMLDWVLLTNETATSYTQLGLIDAINNLLHRDGFPFENPGYNTSFVKAVSEMVEELGDAGEAVTAMPRFRAMFTWPIRMSLLGKFSPSQGDGGNIWNGLSGWGNRVMEPGFRLYRDPTFARALTQHGTAPTHDLFRESLDEAIAEAAARIPARLATESTLMPGLGFATLQTGDKAGATALAVKYGYYWAHAHFDQLNLGLYCLKDESWGYAVTPDLGYPETADSYDPRRAGWLSHTATHNTVMIDARRQEWKRGRLHLFDPGKNVQILEVSAEDCYPDRATLYRRTLMLIDLAPDKACIVEIFRVRGGNQHDWIVHGTAAEFSSKMPLSEPRTEGTLAGAGVPYGVFYDDTRFADNNKAHISYYEYRGSAFQWMFNVRQTELDGVGTASWARGATLRAHLVADHETVFVCDGIPQRRKPYPDTLTFLVRRRVGNDLESIFVTVFEPYWEAPFIESVTPIEIAGDDSLPVALEIRGAGRRLFVVNRLEGSTSPLPVAGQAVSARAAVLERTPDGKMQTLYVLDPENRPATATVNSINYTTREAVLSDSVAPEAPPAGKVAIVTSIRHADVVRVTGSIDGRRLSIGDEDLSAGTLHIQHVDGRNVTFLPRFVEFLRPGMTAVAESGAVVGRISEVDGGKGRMSLQKGLAQNAFPDTNGDGQHTCRIMVIGPGDRVTLHASTRR